MNMIKYLIGILFVFIVIVVAVEMIFFAVTPSENLEGFYSIVLNKWFPPDQVITKVKLGIIGFILITACVIYIFTILFPTRKPQQNISFSTPSGQIQISSDAIEDYAKKVALKIDGIKDIQTAITTSEAGLAFYIKTNVYEGTPLPQLTTELQDSIKRSMKNNLGLEQEMEVNVIIGKIEESKSGKFSSPKSSTPASNSSDESMV